MQEAKRQERSEITPLHCEKSRESILGIYIYDNFLGGVDSPMDE